MRLTAVAKSAAIKPMGRVWAREPHRECEYSTVLYVRKPGRVLKHRIAGSSKLHRGSLVSATTRSLLKLHLA